MTKLLLLFILFSPRKFISLMTRKYHLRSTIPCIKGHTKETGCVLWRFLHKKLFSRELQKIQNSANLFSKVYQVSSQPFISLCCHYVSPSSKEAFLFSIIFHVSECDSVSSNHVLPRGNICVMLFTNVYQFYLFCCSEFEEWWMCWWAPHVRSCKPKGDGISSVDNLLDNIILRIW